MYGFRGYHREILGPWLPSGCRVDIVSGMLLKGFDLKSRIAIFLMLPLILLLGAATSGGVHHTVTKGVTLYRISVSYGVPLKTLMEANRLSSPSAVKVGQKVFVPGAKAMVKVEPYVPLSAKERKSLEKSLENAPELRPPPEMPASPAGADLIWPILGKINSPFGMRGKAFHAGMDIGSPGYQEVRAAMDGEVILARNSGTGYGKLVVLRHAGDLSTIYGHLNVIIAKEGEGVRQGQSIGGVGSTGRSTGPHLHFEVRSGGRPVDPLPNLPPTIEDLLEKAGKK
ncbi:MAG TPA: M23 family metallopeptidase [Thermodesulfobacteriota bacterium]|nr:M23 family metallopeptidase [Thermodesulfobacteriota bacterium]